MHSSRLLSCLAASTLATASIDHQNHQNVARVGPPALTAPTVELLGPISTYTSSQSQFQDQSQSQSQLQSQSQAQSQAESDQQTSSISSQPIDSTTFNSMSASTTTPPQSSSTSPASTTGNHPDSTTANPSTSTGGAILNGVQSSSGSIVGLLGFFIVGLVML